MRSVIAAARRVGRVGLTLVLIAGSAFSGRAAAQDTTQRARPATRMRPALPCDGKVVSRIVVDAQRPPFTGSASYWRKAARAVGLHHATTDTVVVRRYLALHAGDPCTEFRRQESERLLRAQPFLASARVETMPDTSAPGQVVVHVTTRDEIPVLIGAGISGTQLRSASLGTMNLNGRAVLAQAHWSNRRPEGASYGLHGEHMQFLGRPYTLLVDADRATTGSAFGVGAGHAYLTDLQRIAWEVGVLVDDRADFLERPEGGFVALGYRRRIANTTAMVRVGNPRQRILAGGFVALEDVRRRATTSDFAADSLTDAAFPSFRELWIGAATGIRRLVYIPVRGFDALTATQDVATGMQLFTAAARGAGGWAGAATDTYLFGDLYLGAGTPSSFVAGHLRGEGRAPRLHGRWDDVVASLQAAFYWHPQSDESLVRLWTESSGGWRVRIPFQLGLHERTTGLLGYKAPLQGTRRWTAGVDARRSMGRIRDRLDFGIGLFATAGKLYGGDRPFTLTTPVLPTAGISLYGAFPPGSKRLLRLDVGYPLRRIEGSGLELRFTSISASGSVWTEPRDVGGGRARAIGPAVFSP